MFPFQAYIITKLDLYNSIVHNSEEVLRTRVKSKQFCTQKESRQIKNECHSLALKQIVKNWASFLKTKVTNHIFPIYQSFKIQNFSSVYLQRNVRSTFQADIHSLNLTWLSPACVCSFFPLLEYYLLTQFEMSSQNQKRLFFYHEFHEWNNIHIYVGCQVTKGGMQN